MSIIKNISCKRMVRPVIGQENGKSVIHLLCQKNNGDKSVARIMDYELKAIAEILQVSIEDMYE